MRFLFCDADNVRANAETVPNERGRGIDAPESIQFERATCSLTWVDPWSG